MSTHPTSALSNLSLYETLRDVLADRLLPVTCSKASLVHISHTLENIVLQYHFPVLLFAGFQESVYWQQESARYEILSEITQQICIFAGAPLPQTSGANWLHIELDADDPLRQEWFLIILSERFSVLLSSQDNLVLAHKEGARLFDTIWSFETDVIHQAIDVIEAVIAHYRPDRLSAVQVIRQQHRTSNPDMAAITQFVMTLVRFEEALQNDLNQSNQELSRAQEFSNYLIQTSPAFFVTLNGDEQVIVMNEAILKALDYTAAEVVGQDFAWHFVPPEDWEIFARLLSRLNRSDETSTVELRLKAKSGQLILVEWQIKRLLKNGGALDFYALVGTDVTERRQLEQQNFQLAMEQAQSRMLADFVRDASHDFRTPLSIINTSLYLLGKITDPVRRAGQIEVLVNQAAHLEKLVNALFEMAQLDQNSDHILLPVELNSFVESLKYGLRQQVGAKGQVMMLELESPAVSVPMNESEMYQALQNIIQNAVQFTPSGGTITLRTHVTETHAVIEVIDTGIGISAEHLPLIFDRFYRVDKARSTETGGLGLGLTMAQKIVEKHHGSIEVESALGQGSVFRVLLPLRL